MSLKEDFSIGRLTLNGQTNDGTPIGPLFVRSQTVTPTSVGAATVSVQTATVTGALAGDLVIVNPAATGNATAVGAAYVSAANTVSIQYINPTAGSLTPGAGTYKFIIIRP